MSTPFFRLSKNTLIYGSGQVASRLLTFLMLPWTTYYLTPEDYGIVGILGLFAFSIYGVFTLGFGISLGREYSAADQHEARAAVIWSGFVALIVNITFWVSVGGICARPLSVLLFNSPNYSYYVVLTLLNAAFANAQLPFLTYFKVHERTFLVVALTLAEVAVTLLLTIYWVFYCRWGCDGVIMAGVVGQATTLMMMVAIGWVLLPLRFSVAAVKEMVKIGYPYIAGVGGTFLMQFSARYILQLISGREEVGLFFMSSNFGKIAEFIVMAFISAWAPFSITYVNKAEEARELFGRIFSQYAIAMSLLLLCFFAFARPVVELMVQPTYRSVWPMVGVMATTFGVMGFYSITGSGFIFFKRSAMQVAAELFAGLVCILLSFSLIPLLGTMGAALATLGGYCSLVIVTIALNRRLLPLIYELRLAKIAAAFIVAALLTFTPIPSLALYSFFAVTLVLLYCGYLYTCCLTESERQNLRPWQRAAAPSS